MTLQDDFAAAIEQVAAGKRQQIAAAQAELQRQVEQRDAGAQWFREQFELLDADHEPPEPAQQQAAPSADPTDVFNILPNF